MRHILLVLLVLSGGLWAAPAEASYTHIATCSGRSGGDGGDVTTGACTPSDTTAGADLVICSLNGYEGSSEGILADNQANDYSAAGSTPQSNSTRGRIRLYRLQAPTVGAGHRWTVDGDFIYTTLICFAFSGSEASPVDDYAGTNASAAETISAGAVDPTECNELVVAAVGFGSELVEASVAVGGGFAGLTHVATVSGEAIGSALAYRLQGAIVSENPAWTWSNSVTSQAINETYRSTSGACAGGGGVPAGGATLLDAGR